MTNQHNPATTSAHPAGTDQTGDAGQDHYLLTDWRVDKDPFLNRIEGTKTLTVHRDLLQVGSVVVYRSTLDEDHGAVRYCARPLRKRTRGGFRTLDDAVQHIADLDCRDCVDCVGGHRCHDADLCDHCITANPVHAARLRAQAARMSGADLVQQVRYQALAPADDTERALVAILVDELCRRWPVAATTYRWWARQPEFDRAKPPHGAQILLRHIPDTLENLMWRTATAAEETLAAQRAGSDMAALFLAAYNVEMGFAPEPVADRAPVLPAASWRESVFDSDKPLVPKVTIVHSDRTVATLPGTHELGFRWTTTTTYSNEFPLAKVLAAVGRHADEVVDAEGRLHLAELETSTGLDELLADSEQDAELERLDRTIDSGPTNEDGTGLNRPGLPD